MGIRIRLAPVVMAIGLTGGSVQGQEFPVRPLRLVVGYSAGGASDLIARVVAQGVTDVLGRAVIVDNVPGASGTVAAARIAKTTPDGYTLLMISSSDPIQAALRKDLPYRLDTDLAPISLVAIGPYVFSVHPSVSVGSVAQLLALARAHPGKLTFGSSGVGSGLHLAGELFKFMAGVDMLHVPFKGGGENITAAAAGHIDTTFGALPPTLPFVRSNRLKAIAVTSHKRASAIPAVPTLHESGLAGYDRSGWFALVAPAGLSREIGSRLGTAVASALGSRQARESLLVHGLEPQPSTAEELATFMQRESASAARLVEIARLKNQ